MGKLITALQDKNFLFTNRNVSNKYTNPNQPSTPLQFQFFSHLKDKLEEVLAFLAVDLPSKEQSQKPLVIFLLVKSHLTYKKMEFTVSEHQDR